MKQTKGFTLIELLVVITILAILIGLVLSNMASARSRARDATLKQDLLQLKNALRLYYNDYQSYPDDNPGAMKREIFGCGVDGDLECNGDAANCAWKFAAGGAGCDNVYMAQFPDVYQLRDGSMYYRLSDNGDNFCIETSALENDNDPDIAASQARCAEACTIPPSVTSSCSGTEYCVCGD